MLKHKPGFFGIIIALLFASPVFSQVIPKTEVTPAVPDTVIEELKENVLDNIPVVSLDENDDQDGSAQNLSTQVNSGRNTFINAASYNFNIVRFRIRGYDSDLFSTFINGVPMENLDNGFTPYGLWGGLNDVFRNRQYSPGLQATKFGYGSIGGNSSLDIRAFKQRKQTQIGYAVSNRNYNNRASISHSTGWNKKGWAFSFDASRRWAEEGFADGTYYDGTSYYAGVDKRLGSRHILSFVTFGTPTESGRQGSSVREMLDLAGTNYYNPYWGYQNGKKRNASIAKSYQPIGILTHEWTISPKSSLVTGVSYSRGKRSTTALDWYNAADPRPDYYRYLPSYQFDPAIAQKVREDLMNDINKRQINWDALYNTNYNNYETIHNASGITGNDISGKRSLYIVEERIIHTNRLNANTTFNTVVNAHIDVTGGLTYETQRNHYYKEVNDLLGGDFYVNINKFGERDFPADPGAAQNDIDHPDRILYTGDRFGYDYNINITKASAWAQTTVKINKVNFFVSAEHTYTNYYRVGHVRTGLFSDNSFGRSADQNFYNYAAKAGVTYLVSAHNYLFANASHETRAPFFENAFQSPRTRASVQEDLRSERITSIEAGYVLIAPTVKLRLTGYFTSFKNGTDVLNFYDDFTGSFGNYSLNHIGKQNMGIEFGTEVIVRRGLSLNASAAVGRYRYNTRQNAVVTEDNSAEVLERSIVYAKNFYVPAPQQAYSVGFYYRSPKYWFLSASFNYFDDMYLQFSPVRRTTAATDGLDPNSAEFHNVIDQTKLKAQHTLDASAGWSWLMNNRFRSMGKRTFLLFNLGVNNILNSRDIVSGGFEQLRFDFAQKDPQKYSDKRFYAYGINFFASIGLRF